MPINIPLTWWRTRWVRHWSDSSSYCPPWRCGTKPSSRSWRTCPAARRTCFPCSSRCLDGSWRASSWAGCRRDEGRSTAGAGTCSPRSPGQNIKISNRVEYYAQHGKFNTLRLREGTVHCPGIGRMLMTGCCVMQGSVWSEWWAAIARQIFSDGLTTLEWNAMYIPHSNFNYIPIQNRQSN